MLAEEYSLHYLRTKEGHEVDFSIILQDRIESMIEVKLSNPTASYSIVKFHNKYNHPAIQLVKSLRNEHENQGEHSES